MTTAIDLDLAQGPPLHYQEDPSSPDLIEALSEMIFHFDEINSIPKREQPESSGPLKSDP
jgi:hypothetical protein